MPLGVAAVAAVASVPAEIGNKAAVGAAHGGKADDRDGLGRLEHLAGDGVQLSLNVGQIGLTLQRAGGSEVVHLGGQGVRLAGNELLGRDSLEIADVEILLAVEYGGHTLFLLIGDILQHALSVGILLHDAGAELQHVTVGQTFAGSSPGKTAVAAAEAAEAAVAAAHPEQDQKENDETPDAYAAGSIVGEHTYSSKFMPEHHAPCVTDERAFPAAPRGNRRCRKKAQAAEKAQAAVL